VFLLFVASALAQEPSCPGGADRYPAVELGQRAELAVERLEEGDFKGFEVGLVEVRARLPCAGEPLKPEGAAAIHLLEGVADWREGQQEAAHAHLWAAYWFDGRSPSIFEVLPEPEALGVLWASFDEASVDWNLLPPSYGGQVHVDGEWSRFVLEDAAWIYQFDDSALGLTTRYMDANRSPEDYPDLRRMLKRRVLWTAVGAGLTSALGLAAASRFDSAHEQVLAGTYSDPIVSPRSLTWVNRGSLLTAGLLSAVAVTATVRLIRSYRFVY